MKSNTYIIRCLSNLHVGGEGESYGAIDKLVQRDAASKFPVIHGSGIKGALREWYRGKENEIAIFGSDPKDSKNLPGTYNFQDAHLLTLPIRSNVLPYFNATSKSLIEAFIEHCELYYTGEAGTPYLPKDLIITALLKILGKSSDPTCKVFNQPDYNTSIILEDWVTKNEDIGFSTEEKKVLKHVFGSNIALLPDTQMIELSKNLPVIARNYLENGKSENLWYEEVVPRESRFYTMIQRKEVAIKETFETAIEESILQLGAHATIGYGQTKFINLNKQ
jgi:CRISPR-associated protein Cmr4